MPIQYEKEREMMKLANLFYSLGNAFNLTPHTKLPKVNKTFIQDDQKALQDDWAKIGQDMHTVLGIQVPPNK